MEEKQLLETLNAELSGFVFVKRKEKKKNIYYFLLNNNFYSLVYKCKCTLYLLIKLYTSFFGMILYNRFYSVLLFT